MANRPNRPCPPGQVRPTPAQRCQPRPFIMTPTGGPASGLWPQGSNVGPASGPTPAPAPSCIAASIFADCFASCTGTIDGGAPGPICGWTFIEPFGAAGGTITFSVGSMSFNTAGPTEFPSDTKPLPATLLTVNGMSGQFEFTEFQTPPTASTAYDFIVTNQANDDSLVVAFFGDGGIIFQVGDPANGSNYLGAWTPDGGTHQVAFQIDALGVPSLWLDGVPMALVFIGMGASVASFFPANAVSFFFASDSATPATASVMNTFLTLGALPPQTEFCCP